MDGEIAVFVRDLVAQTEVMLGERLIAISLVGSLATGDAHPATSDVDVLVVVDRAPDGPQRDTLADHVVTLGLDCPWAGLEYVVYQAHAVRAPAYPLPYLLNVNAGPRRDRHVTTAWDPVHWFLLDVAMARQHSIPLRGPPPCDLIAEPRTADVLCAIRDALMWHAAHDAASPNAVLNACRSWRWIDTRTWTSKSAAARWALAHVSESDDAVLISQSLAARHAPTARLDDDKVAAFLARLGQRADDHPFC